MGGDEGGGTTRAGENGTSVGRKVGRVVGRVVGFVEGRLAELCTERGDGAAVLGGWEVGKADGFNVGFTEGDVVGLGDGCADRRVLGVPVGRELGS